MIKFIFFLIDKDIYVHYNICIERKIHQMNTTTINHFQKIRIGMVLSFLLLICCFLYNPTNVFAQTGTCGYYGATGISGAIDYKIEDGRIIFDGKGSPEFLLGCGL